MYNCCHFPQGKCGLKSSTMQTVLILSGHFPQGKCGLKFLFAVNEGQHAESLPSGEVWIEIRHACNGCRRGGGHFPQGKCGLKCRFRASEAGEMVVTSLRGSVD